MAEIVLGHLLLLCVQQDENVAKPTQMNARAVGEQAHHGDVKGQRELRGFRAHDDDCRINLSVVSIITETTVEIRSLTGSE